MTLPTDEDVLRRLTSEMEDDDEGYTLEQVVPLVRRYVSYLPGLLAGSEMQRAREIVLSQRHRFWALYEAEADRRRGSDK